jgi:hypothetical protein
MIYIIDPEGVERAVGAVNATYWKGDKAVYTGNVLQLHGGTFYEIQMVEGHLKGQLEVTKHAPVGTSKM